MARHERRDRVIALRVSSEEAREMWALAATRGTTLSATIRWLVRVATRALEVWR